MAGVLDMVTTTTTANYAKGAWDGLSQNNPVWSEMKKAGTILYDQGGETLQGSVEMGRHTPIVSAPGMDLSAQFIPKQRYKMYSFPWGEIANAFVIDKGLLRRNTGPQALVNLRDKEIPAMIRDTIVGTNGLAHQLLNQDGVGYTSTGLPMYGLPSFLHAPAATGLQGFDGAATVTGTGPADTDPEATMSSTSATYGGLSMERGAITGVDGLEADAWTPTLVNSSYTGWSGTADDEANSVLIFLQYAANRARRFSANDPTKKPTFGLLDQIFYNYAGNKIATKQTIYVQSGQGSVQTPNLGYDTYELMHAGLRWLWDENMPASTGYVINANQLKFHCQPLYSDEVGGNPLNKSGEDAGLIETFVGPDPIRRQYMASATIPGQFCAAPRFFVRIGGYS